MTNPLLTPSTLPYNLPDFAAIRLEHVEPAFEEALKRHAAEIAEITTAEAPTWSNTCLLYTSPSPRDATLSRMPSSA